MCIRDRDNGFCVLRIKARGHRELVTVIGHAAVISAGEWVTASGDWVNDRTHGQQYKAKFLKDVYKRQVTMSACLGPQNTKAVIAVMERDALDEAR